jgi:hypothetical protein
MICNPEVQPVTASHLIHGFPQPQHINAGIGPYFHFRTYIRCYAGKEIVYFFIAWITQSLY